MAVGVGLRETGTRTGGWWVVETDGRLKGHRVLHR